jgi:glycerophosphoryl diester phosphodiesterase
MRRQELFRKLKTADFLLWLELANILVVLPLFRLLFSWLLNEAQYTLLSLSGLVQIVTDKPLIALLLVFAFAAVAAVACLEVKLVGRHYQAKTSPFFLIWLPWLALLFRTPLFALTQWPSFFWSHIRRSWIFALLFGVFYLIAFAWLKNKKRLLSLWRPLGVQLTVGLICYLLSLLWPGLTAAGIFVSELVGEACWLAFLLKLLNTKAQQSKKAAWLPTAVFTLFAIPVAIMLAVPAHKPLLISHRGVSQANGVQNTLPVLKRTSKQHPAYIEIDLHETHDHQFIVMHDDQLTTLAGVDKYPYELTLAQLKKISLHENGHAAKIASFDDYLKTADKLHQKLLIELKTTPHDSPQMLKNFIRRYDKRLHGNLLQSADLGAVAKLRKLTTRPVFYIESYNLTYPQKAPTGFSMDYSSFNAYFYSQTKRPVYLWTPDSRADLRHALALRPAGIITDDLPQAKQVWRDYQPQWQLVAYLLPLLF